MKTESQDTILFKKLFKAKIDLTKELLEYLCIDLGETNIKDIKYTNNLITSENESDKNIGLIESFESGKLSDYSFGSGCGGTVEIGEFVKNIGDFNIVNALKWGSINHKPVSIGQCAKYVRLMLEAGGINTSGHPISAYKYASFLPSKGFKHIATLNGREEQTNFSNTDAIPGDIAVMSHGQHGHICIFTGKQWLSDFPQNNMWPYSGNGVCNIFRYDNS